MTSLGMYGLRSPSRLAARSKEGRWWRQLLFEPGLPSSLGKAALRVQNTVLSVKVPVSNSRMSQL